MLQCSEMRIFSSRSETLGVAFFSFFFSVSSIFRLRLYFLSIFRLRLHYFFTKISSFFAWFLKCLLNSGEFHICYLLFFSFISFSKLKLNPWTQSMDSIHGLNPWTQSMHSIHGFNPWTQFKESISNLLNLFLDSVVL